MNRTVIIGSTKEIEALNVPGMVRSVWEGYAWEIEQIKSEEKLIPISTVRGNVNPYKFRAFDPSTNTVFTTMKTANRDHNAGRSADDVGIHWQFIDYINT